MGRAQDMGQVLVGEELRQIRAECWSGVLALTQGEVAKGLYFLDGDVVFATSTVEEDRLGAHLFRNGRITESQFRAAMAAAQTPGRRLGTALIEAGVLSPAELEAAVVSQVERIVLSVFRWSSGRVQRREMDRPLPADLVLDLCMPRLLLLGAREVLHVSRLEQALGSEEQRLRRVFQVEFDYAELRPSPVERAVLEAAAGETTLGDALGLPHPPAQLVRAVYALVAGGLLETIAAPSERPVMEPAEVALPPEGVPHPDPDDTLRGGPRGTVAPVDGLLFPGLTAPADWAVSRDSSPEPATRPLPGLDPDLLTPNPPPDSEIPGLDEPALDEAAPGYGTVGADPGLEVPSNPRDGERRARSLLENGLREPAVAMLRVLVERHPDAVACRRLLVTTMALSGGFDPVVEGHFLSVLEAEPEDLETRCRLARYYRRAGMTARAVLQLRLVLSSDSGHAEAWRDLGELEASAGRR